MKLSPLGLILSAAVFAPLSAQAAFYSQSIDFTDQTLAANWDNDADQATDAVTCSSAGVDNCNKSADILFDLTTVGYTAGTTIADWSVTLFLVDDEDSSSGPETSGAWTNNTSGSFQANERLRAAFGGVNFNELNGLTNGAEDISDSGRTAFTITDQDTFQTTTAAQVADIFTALQGNGKLKAVYQTFAGDMIIQSATLSVNTTAVPVPAAAWLMGSALLGLGVVRRH
jgi:hypothetical protein